MNKSKILRTTILMVFLLITCVFTVQAQLFASGDVNNDAVVSAIDLNELVKFVIAGGPAPELIYEGDLSGDGYLDEDDIDLLVCYLFMGGETCFDEYPVPTFDEVDTTRGCCCLEDEVRTLSEENCAAAKGNYMGGGNLCYLPGNADPDYLLNIFDVTYLISYIYQYGPRPDPHGLISGDSNCDCISNIFDITNLISHLYKDGPAPCNTCDWVFDCGLPIR